MIYFYDFSTAGGGPSGDVTIAVQDFNTGTTTGSPISHTTSALTGVTPAGVMLVGTYHDVASGTSETAGAILGVGFHTTGVQQSGSVSSRDNLASTSSWRAPTESNSINLRDGGGGTDECRATTALVSGGIENTYSFMTANRTMGFTAFAGADVEALAGNVNLGTGTSAVSTNVGFEPDVVILFSVGPSGTGTPARGNFGILTATEQRCAAMSEPSSNAAGNAPVMAVLTDVCMASLSTAGALEYEATGAITGTGFNLTPSASASSAHVKYLALKFTGRQVALIDYTTPTSTGSRAVTGVGFTPQWVLAVLTNLEATDPSFPISTSDLMGGLAVCSIGDEQWSHAIRLNSGSDPTDTASFTGNYAVVSPSATDCKAGLASLTSFDSDGWTENWSVVQANAKVGFALAIE